MSTDMNLLFRIQGEQSEQARVLTKLGITETDPERALSQTLEALQAMPDEKERENGNQKENS